LDKYAELPNLTMMAIGSAHWSPPVEALERLAPSMHLRETHRYGNLLGLPALQDALRARLQKHGLETSELELAVTAGANQAFMNLALLLCDQDDECIILAPYYFSHKLALQLAGAKISLCAFDPETLKPNWDELERTMTPSSSSPLSRPPKMLVMTSPCNPSGVVFDAQDLERIVRLCKATNTWLVVDQTYYEFLYEDATHLFPCSTRFGYDRIVHIFSLSKAFGMAGWRVGYTVFPKQLASDFRKIQDTNPTHASMISQRLALECIRADDDGATSAGEEHVSFVKSRVLELSRVREAIWPIVAAMGTVRSSGAFYFLVPLPKEVSEEEAVDLLAREYGVLLMLGFPFGAPQHLRLSFGGIPPADAMSAVDRLKAGFERIVALAEERRK